MLSGETDLKKKKSEFYRFYTIRTNYRKKQTLRTRVRNNATRFAIYLVQLRAISERKSASIDRGKDRDVRGT